MEKVFTKEDLIDLAIEVYQPRTSRKLTREDGREILENLSNFFHVLQDWENQKALNIEANKGRKEWFGYIYSQIVFFLAWLKEENGKTDFWKKKREANSH